MTIKYDVAIIGSGPAGLTAGIYSSRAQLKTIVIEGNQPGGQLMTTTAVENWPGEISIQGPDLMLKMREQTEHCGATLLQESIVSVDFSKRPFTLTSSSGAVIEAKSVIIATGASHKKLGCPGEQEYFSKGVAVCATCDAPFYRDKEVVVVGGGNTAVTEVEHLTHHVKKITVIQISEALSANDPIKFKVLDHPKVSFMYNSIVKEIKGNGNNVTGLTIENTQTKEITELSANGVFVAIGFNPNTELFNGQLERDRIGYITVTNNTITSVEGVFAAGDVSDWRYRQAITSAGMGCQAALDAQTFLAKQV